MGDNVMNMGQLVEQGSGEIFPLGFEQVGIGRHADNSIILPDPLISRHHAEIVMQGGRWVIVDLGSANGTFVNGKAISGPHVLAHGDLVRLGQTQFKVEIQAAIADQDTLVEPVPQPASAAITARRLPGGGVALALAAVAVVLALLVALFVVRPLLQRDDDVARLTPPATATSGSDTDSTASPAATAIPTARPRPTTTPIPTIPPPTAATVIAQPRQTVPAVTASPLPVIGRFRAGQSLLSRGACTQLEWEGVENATRITLSDTGRVGPSGRIDVCPEESRTYILTASGPGGIVHSEVEIGVQQPAGPLIEYLRVVPSIIAPGECAQLEWGSVANSLSASIEPGIGGVGTPGSLEVCPGATTTYILVAENPEGNSTARTTLYVATDAEPSPVIAFFTANPGVIQAGQCTTLSWGKVDYASTVTIDNNIGGVVTPGSKEICLATTTTFIISAEGSGGTATSELTVNVSSGPVADLPDLVLESILFEPNPCYRGQRCKVRLTIRNDGSVDAGPFIVHWAPQGQGQVPVEWDLVQLKAGQQRELVYPWIPSSTAVNWRTLATIDRNNSVEEIEEGLANDLAQFITVLEP
jgi:hypothetical protein